MMILTLLSRAKLCRAPRRKAKHRRRAGLSIPGCAATRKLLTKRFLSARTPAMDEKHEMREFMEVIRRALLIVVRYIEKKYQIA